MLGTVRNLPVAEIYVREPVFGDKNKKWHVALHHNDEKDRIAYLEFFTKDEAYRFAFSKCKSRDSIFVLEKDKLYVDEKDVKFKCAHCGEEIDKFMSGEVAHLDEKMYPVCNRCMSKFLRMEK